MNPIQKFNLAASIVSEKVGEGLDQNQKLEIYSLYKQALQGDNKKPTEGLSGSDLVKCEAWNKKKGMSKDEAKKQYVELAMKFYPKEFEGKF